MRKHSHDAPVVPRFFFMDREFPGHVFNLLYLYEEEWKMPFLFRDDWYYLYYRFLSCRNMLLSEHASALRSHLFDLAASVCMHADELLKNDFSQAEVEALIAELVEICEYSHEFPVCLWIRGDDLCLEILREERAKLPPPQQMTAFMSLPHMKRMEFERLEYQQTNEILALKRFHRAQAEYNKQRKLRDKNAQRQKDIEDAK